MIYNYIILCVRHGRTKKNDRRITKGAEIAMTASEKKQLMATACKVRMGIIDGTHSAKAEPPLGGP